MAHNVINSSTFSVQTDKMFNLLLISIEMITLLFQANPPELGKVAWLRNLEEARQQSQKLNKPLLILFQEVPGCATCQNYGIDVLSHPLVVEAIETYFVPLCIYNNKSGNDASALSLFKEPPWNNPVVRIVNPKLVDEVSRLSGNYSLYGLTAHMNALLLKKGIPIPEYLEILEEEARSAISGTETLYLQMHCFWVGERLYGQLKGIVGTTAGFMNGNEVVEIQFDPKRVSATEIIEYGKKNNIADKLYTKSYKQFSQQIPSGYPSRFIMDPENKYYLFQSKYKYIPMTPLQAIRANILLYENQNIDHLFSARQLQWLANAMRQEKKERIHFISKEMTKVWYP